MAEADPFADVNLSAIRSSLLEWYEANRRSFPWRNTDDPWAILVCEVMSQQTQLDRIREPWRAFLERWPTPEALAATDRSDVVAFWSDHSLGYNNRARYLHQAAEQITTEFDGKVPSEPSTLEQLQGVGPYTANAVASFAFNAGDAVVDTNVKRILYRAFDIPDDDGAFQRAASSLLPSGRSRDWNNAIMELGGVVCRPRPRCDEEGCPWRGRCAAYRTGDFTAPDVSTQPEFEGSRRQFRGRIVRALAETEALTLAELGPKVRVDYDPENEQGREWLRNLVADLVEDGLVAIDESTEPPTIRLRR
ncbi:MAG: A/G-specific adenine glycosylase [Salinirussus sp.]